MVSAADLQTLPGKEVTGYRLVNSKFPPIGLFDDVASEEEFAALHALQALTNPRLLNELGNLALLPREHIPFGIRGCSYAAAPFTHINPQGSRFSDGSFGVLYFADTLETAIAEVKYHQQAYWQNVPGLHYERFVFRGLRGVFDEGDFAEASALPVTHAIYNPEDYSVSQPFGADVRRHQEGLRYHSVRYQGALCWALMTPRSVAEIVQTTHLEMIWNGAITQVNHLRSYRR
ncbi:MAG: RES domain-containing protein [Halomonas sp.]|nr:RES family NAD+ phosphorylase [Halomonas sp.]TVP49382.1 MAG: RES domain-containing protein [Halomonas sp.]